MFVLLVAWKLCITQNHKKGIFFIKLNSFIQCLLYKKKDGRQKLYQSEQEIENSLYVALVIFFILLYGSVCYALGLIVLREGADASSRRCKKIDIFKRC